MKLDITNCDICLHDIDYIQEAVMNSYKTLFKKNGAGNEYTGWLNYSYDDNIDEFNRIKIAAKKIREDSQTVIVIGTGGSYLGAKATINALKGQDYNELSDMEPKIYFAGNTLSHGYLNKLLKVIENTETSLIVISKSGSTLEPSVAFRILKNAMENKYKETSSKRIYVVTDKEKGTLKHISDLKGYETFVVPDDIGGRYSVFTPVGLLPIACAGLNIDDMIKGLKDAENEFSNPQIKENICCQYAALRYLLGKNNNIEILTCYNPDLKYISEWWKQLYGESEGKEGKGIFPTSLVYTTDLHSMGQLIQDGNKIFFETTVFIDNVGDNIVVPYDEENLDNLNCIAGKSIEYINEKAMEATIKAHKDGGVQNILIKLPKLDEYNIAKLYYFFMVSCAIGCYLLELNPFNQNGVEKYKNNIKKLLNI